MRVLPVDEEGIVILQSEMASSRIDENLEQSLPLCLYQYSWNLLPGWLKKKKHYNLIVSGTVLPGMSSVNQNFGIYQWKWTIECSLQD